MPPVDERYNELPAVTRAWLASLDEDEIVHLKNLTRFYSRLRDRPWVLAWLEGAREDEIELLDDGIRLIRAGSVIGKAIWVTLGLLVAGAILFSQFGDAFNKMFRSLGLR